MFVSKRDEITVKWDNHIKKNEMDRACGTDGEKERYIQGVSKDLMEKDYLEDLGEDRRLILKWISKKYVR